MATFTKKSIKDTPPWTIAFADVCLRALLKVHLDYLDWSASQELDKESVDAPLITGQGVALADELSVCAAITREFMTSRTVFSAWFEGRGNATAGERYFRISREIKYPAGGHPSKEAVDMVIERIDRAHAASPASPWRPVYVEAKRAYCRTTKLQNGNAVKSSSQRSQIKTDIAALRRVGNVAPITAVTPRGYILVWNVTDPTGRNANATPEAYFKTFDDKVLVWQTRFAPLCTRVDSAARGDLPAKVFRWLWVALAEVTDQAPNDLTA